MASSSELAVIPTAIPPATTTNNNNTANSTSSPTLQPKVGVRLKIDLRKVDDVAEEVSMDVELVLQYPAPANYGVANNKKRGAPRGSTSGSSVATVAALKVQPIGNDDHHLANGTTSITASPDSAAAANKNIVDIDDDHDHDHDQAGTGGKDLEDHFQPVDMAVLRAQGLCDPRVEFSNMSKATEQEDNAMLMNTVTGRIFNIRRCRVSIREPLELGRFPFDRQIVHFRFRSFSVDLNPWFPIGEDEIPFGIKNVQRWMNKMLMVSYDETDWFVERLTTKFTKIGLESSLEICIGMTRNPKFYMTNVALIEYILVQLAIFTIAVDPSDYGTRASVNITIMLTIVAFKFVINTFLPVISYLTWLDKYIICGFVLVGCSITENFFVSSLFLDHDTAKLVDKYFAIVYTAIWIPLNLIAILGYIFKLFVIPWAKVEKMQNPALSRNALDADLSLNGSSVSSSSLNPGDEGAATVHANAPGGSAAAAASLRKRTTPGPNNKRIDVSPAAVVALQQQ